MSVRHCDVVTEMTISHLACLHILDICPLVDIFIALAKFAVILGANRGLVILAFVSRSDNIKTHHGQYLWDFMLV